MFFSLFKSIGNLVVSIGTTELLKNLCNDNEKNKASKIEGRATASWWILEAISAIVSGYFFQINYYISYYINIGLLFIAFLTTFFFNVKNENKTDNLQTETVVENKNVNKKEYIKNMLIFVFIAFAFWGAAEVFGSSAKTFFQEIGTTSVLIGWIYFAVKIITATCNFFSYRLERKLGYRFLPAVILAFLSSVLLMVTIYFIETTFVVKLILIIVSLVFMYITRNHYRLNIKNTMVNIYEKKQIGKVYSYYFMSENLGGVVFSLIASITIDKLDLGWSMMINLIIIALMLIPLLIIYSKTFKTQYKNNLINKGSLTGLNDEANSADRENSQNIK